MQRWLVAVVVILVAGGACRGGQQTAASRAGGDPLALLPSEARVVIGVDLVRARQAPIAAQLAAFRPLLADPLAAIDTFTEKTGFDPWHGIHSIVIARSNSPDQWGIVVRGALLDEQRLETYVRGLQKEARDLVSTKRGSLTLWSLRDKFGMAAFFADRGTFLVGTGGWAERMADLVRGAPSDESAASNRALAKLREPVREHAIWIAGEFPDDLRAILQADAGLRSLGAAAGVSVAVDLDDSVRASLAADLATAEAADETAENVAKWLVSERRGGQAAAVLKGMTAYAEGTTFRLSFEMDGKLITKIADTAALMRDLARPKPASPVAGSERPAIKFTAVGGETWTSAIAVSDIRTFRWLGRPVTMMEILNRTTKPVAPQVAVLFRDADGRSVKGESCVLPMLVVLPRERMPCVVSAPAGAVTGDYSVALLPDAKASELAGVVRANLKVLEARLESPPGPAQLVVGTVMNDTRATLQGVRVHASFYDSARKLVGYGLTEIDRPMKPGAKVPFEVTTSMLPAQAKSFTATAFVLPPQRP